MYIIISDHENSSGLVANFLAYTKQDAEIRTVDGFAAYTLEDGTVLTQSNFGILVPDHNFPRPLQILREFVLGNEVPLGFMHIEDGISLRVLPSNKPTTQQQLANFTINCDESLSAFIESAIFLLDNDGEEEQPDLHDQAANFAFETTMARHSLGDQYFAYQITFGMPEKIGTTFRNDPESYRTFSNSNNERYDALMGNNYFIIVEEFSEHQHLQNGSFIHLYAGKLNVFYDDLEEVAPLRDDVIKIATHLSSERMPLILLDVDENAFQDGAAEHGYWQEKFTFKEGKVHHEPDFWEGP